MVTNRNMTGVMTLVMNFKQSPNHNLQPSVVLVWKRHKVMRDLGGIVFLLSYSKNSNPPRLSTKTWRLYAITDSMIRWSSKVRLDRKRKDRIVRDF